ncbi:MAG: T9SS type A sorting domain-containing protein [Bacteroidales bacterium]|nr:T9SS type A sorting domain-containing protein [Bacteroidales bacterium]
MKRIFIFLLVAVFSLNVYAQEKDLRSMMKERNEFYFSFEIDDLQDLAKIAKVISIDNVDGNKVTAYANNKQYERFLTLGMETTLLTPPSMLENHKMFDGRTRAEYDWDEYPTYEAYVAMMEEFAATYPEKCTLIELGTLNSGRKILLARINDGNPDGKPKFLYGSTIHGDETTGFIMMLRLIDLLLTQPDLPEVKNVLDNIDLFVCPNANPDGTYHGGNNTVNGATRYNAYGVDMNRNYPDPVDGAHPDGESYAMETEWFMDLAEEYQFTMSAHYHGGAEVMNYPWDNNYERHADDAWWQMVSREYADLCHEVNSNYMTDMENGITNGADWYTIGGGRQDFMNYYHQCREVTIECSTTKCPSASQLPTFWEYNYNSIFAYMNQVLYGIQGTVKDAATKEPLKATIEILNHDQDYSIVESQLPMGNFHRPINAGTYTIEIKANGYLPIQKTVTVVDGEATVLDVELEEGEGLIPDFSASATDVSIGSEVQFTDETWGANVVSWCWRFEGAEPESSIIQNPTVKYNEVGSYDVTLTVTNADGDSQSITKQRYINVTESYNMDDVTITTCNALFYDYGGPNNNYPDNDVHVMTFKPATEGAMIQVEFLEFNTEENYDILRIYNGTGVGNNPCLAELSGSSLPGKYTASNTEGTLTFRFLSDYSYNNPGWKAVIRCIGGEMSVSAEASQDTICLGESVNLSAYAEGGSGEYTYSWSPAELLDNPNAQNPVATPTEEGEIVFTVEISDGTDTKNAEVVVYVENCVGVNEYTTNDVVIYPNPAKDMVNVTLNEDSENISWTLINMHGQVVKKMNEVSGSFEIDLNDVDKGIYFLNVSVDDKPIIKKIVVE